MLGSDTRIKGKMLKYWQFKYIFKNRSRQHINICISGGGGPYAAGMDRGLLDLGKKYGYNKSDSSTFEHYHTGA